MKKLAGFLLLMCMVLGLFSGYAYNVQADQQTLAQTEGEVTRLEWLKALTTAFKMEVEEQNYSDNYYSDVDASSADYYDIMLATEFGLIDVEAGDALRPNDVATREFAVHTLNLCMGYLPDENMTYTFSEASNVTYPDDIQIAIDKGWIALSGNNFLPEQGITQAEMTKMITEAEEVVASVEIDPNYENSFHLVDGVILVPETTPVALTNDNELTFTNLDVSISKGDIFVVYSSGFPVPRRAVSVTTAGNKTIIVVEEVDMEEAFTSIEAQGTMEADLTQIQAVDESVELTYIVGGTAENAYEDGIAYQSLAEVGEQKVTAVIATRSVDSMGAYGARGSIALGDYASIKCKITNVSADYDVSILKQKAYLNVYGTVTFSFTAETGDLPILGFEEAFVRVPIGIIGYFEPSAEGSIQGSMSLSMKGRVSAGVQWTGKNGVRLNYDFKKEAFTIQSQVEANLGVKAAAGVDVGFLKAELYAKAGANASVETTTHIDNELPRECKHVSGYLYASAGADAEFNLIIYKNDVSLSNDFITEENSPVKIALHYEDGKAVDTCTRDVLEDPESGETKKYKYYTPIDSQYAFSGLNKGVSSKGEEYTIFDYTVNDDGNAVITGYHGNVSALTIPNTIDGYTVVEIDSYVFKENLRLMVVNIPDTVTKIGTSAFTECSNLMDVTLSKSLVSMGYYAFKDCDSLTSIEIPKSLEKTTSLNSTAGAFYGCDNLKTVTFEEGATEVAEKLFVGCTGLEEITIPDTVTIIEANAFKDCVNLENVKISSFATEIQEYAFSGCESLTEIVIPDTVTTIGRYAFNNCSNLLDVTLSKSLEMMGYYAFRECDRLTSIEIPKSLEETTSLNSYAGAFNGCDNLKTVIFENGVTEVPQNLFEGCTGLEEITIPDTVTVIEASAFKDCENLESVKISSYATEIQEYAFSGCKSLTKIVIPDTVTTIGRYAFNNCSNLQDVTLSKLLVTMGYYAFRDCDSLTSIEIPKSLKKTTALNNYAGAFNNCDNLKTITFEEGVTKIAENLFEGCTGIEKITIPNTVTAIGDSAFKDSTNLKTVTWYTGIKTIGSEAFSGCSSLASIAIPDTVTDMGTYAFNGCTSLSSVKLSNAQKAITERAFQNCSSLEQLELPESVTTIAQYAFQGSGLKSISLPNSVTSIGNYAFQNSNLSMIQLSEKLTTIGNYAFNNCDSLTAISIPDSVTSLGTYCFADCNVLADVRLGGGLTKINSYTFNLCPELTSIILPYRVTTVAANAFTNCTKLVELTIPRATTSIATNAFSYPTNMTIYGVSGTYAEEWADSVGATFVHQEKPATAATLNYSELTLNKGKTATLVVNVTPADFTDEMTWKSSDTTVATVSDAGVITAKAVGTSTIRVTVGNVSASCKLTVVQPVTSISLNKTSLSLEDEQTYTLTASVSPSSANDKTVTWSSSDESVASVDQSGVVTAKQKGTAAITVTANDGSGVSKTCNVTVVNNHIYCKQVSELESTHNYENDCQDVWIYERAGASEISVTFDERTEVEDEFDFIYLYDALDVEIGKYTGTELAGKTITVEGNTIKIKLASDNAGNAWGFKVTSVKGDNDLSIVTQPVSKTVKEGENAVFKVVAEGEGLTYQWQYSTDGKSWLNSGMTGAKTASLTVEGLSRRNGQRYRCVITDASGNTVTSNVATLTVKTGPVITSQPSSQTVNVGGTVTFKVVASGTNLSYQWQYKVAGGNKWNNSGATGAKTASLSVEGTEARNGQQYRCIITDGSGESVTSNVATLTVKAGPAITSQPASQTVVVGQKATFSVKASGSNLSYQWQYKVAGGSKWNNSGAIGAKTASLEVEGTEARNGQQYRCIITDGSGNSVTSNAATLNVKAGLAITIQPASQTVNVGGTATFKVVASGSNLSYQWQYKVAGGSKWNNSGATGAKTTSLSVEGTEARNGQQYRCIITDGSGNSVTSNAATLTVKAGLSITSQPANQTVSVGQTATFKVVASGSSLSYQWQYKVAGGSKWNNSGATGAKTASLSVEGTEARNGQQYRCIITDGSGNSVTSNAATLTVKAGLAITIQPTSQTVNVGETATFKVVASGSNLRYQWQYKVAGGGKWNNSSATGAKTASLSVEGTEARNGQQYRCVITDGSGNSVTSNAAILTVKAGLAITSQPTSQTVNVGETATFKVVASGSSLSYQWQYKTASGTKWYNSSTTGAKTASITIEGTEARNGQQYRCVITDGSGNTVTSNAATLTVKAGLAITSQPTSQTVSVGGKATFTVVASGSNLSYQWQYKVAGGGKWNNSGTTGANTASITIEGTEARNGQQYRCVITDGSGNQVISDAATLNVK